MKDNVQLYTSTIPMMESLTINIKLACLIVLCFSRPSSIHQICVQIPSLTVLSKKE